MCCGLTVHVPVLGHGVDLFVGQHLYVLAAGAAVELVDADESAAHAVCHPALLAHMLREIRRGLIGYLSRIGRHCMSSCSIATLSHQLCAKTRLRCNENITL